MSSPTPPPDQHRERLPTLFEVLSRRTSAPVDLFFFYIYMRDQQRSVDYLDFWLDVSQHMALCRHYVRELRRTNLFGTPELEKSASKRSSAMLENMPEAGGPSNEKDKGTPEQRLSAFLRDEHMSRQHSPQNSRGSNHSDGSGPDRLPRPSFMTSNNSGSPLDDSPIQDSNHSPGHTVNRSDIRASAEKILYTYLLPGSEREIILPQSILDRITNDIEVEKRDDPEVFDTAKDYVFQAMERDAFPGFLRSKAFGNLVPPSMMIRLIIGLLAMFGGFWAAFCLIFLNHDRPNRCWLILPFTIGVYMLASHQYMLDPFLVFAGYSETTFGNFGKIREPFVKKLLHQRAWMVLLVILLADAALCCLFILVPGKRL
ncbi:RGS domain protein [Saccharata proteae CBS 121410]|uniref:RGS domain protein n=1 Tax=Saccharata proteae CBS 121410 TaxID=1314787 RepID=A0A9P4I210_9PEZI|nr:RGS domain protein [Saccharata proteae CBS 121410]